MFLANWNIWVDVEGSLVLFMKQNLLQINLLDFPKYIQLSTLKKVMVKVISISGHPLWTQTSFHPLLSTFLDLRHISTNNRHMKAPFNIQFLMDCIHISSTFLNFWLEDMINTSRLSSCILDISKFHVKRKRLCQSIFSQF